ncbi:immunoglobulin-like domain-containing protein [Stigmatella aurantiaca]|uniref:immunoglobulin-like domain-containing protein n=1 Tax=Stigmatella aurantiaca TaxID=41 RepID=UPI0002EAE868|nr:immunoglobulin-like domain-containing protein [Stigmatella aurantiaca]
METSKALQLSVNGGVDWFHPEPLPSPHASTSLVTGQGAPLAVRLVGPLTSGKTGTLTLTLELLPPAPTCQANSECDDGSACTVDTCTPEGTCGHEQVLCVAGTACTPDPGPASPPPNEGEAPTPGSNTCVDASWPSLVVNGALDMTLECGVNAWVDPGASATDACGAVPVRTYNSGHDPYGPGPNPCAEGTYPVQYIAWNALGYTVKAIRSVRVDDRTPPTLKLKGPAFMTHPCGSQWEDPGVEAFDACYGYIWPEVKWQGEVNGWVEGTYTKVYTLTDSGGNAALPVSRTVQVVHCPWK